MDHAVSIVAKSKCSFCAIVTGSAPAKIVHETGTTLAFVPLNPATVGHILLIPKIHSAGLFDTPEHQLMDIMRVSKTLGAKIKEVTGCEGMNIIQSNGSCATQTIMHYHMHLVPRNEGDGFGPIWPTRPVSSSGVKSFVAAMGAS